MILITLKIFSLTGGIEKVSRSLSKALMDLQKTPEVEKLKVISLCDKTVHANELYCDKQNFKGFNGNKILFGLTAPILALKSNIIILSHINLLVIAAIVKLLAPKKRVILLAHGIEVWRDLSGWKKNFIRRNVEVWAVSNHTAGILTDKHKISSKNIIVLNNCLDPFFDIPENFKKPEYLLKRHGLSTKQPVLLTISRLSSFELYKGYDLVIENIKSLLEDFPDLMYIIAGKADVKEKSRLWELIKNEALQEHVLMLDFISDKELTDYFLLADTFIMPSKKEGFGLVFIEAAACGCNVIAGNQDGSRDALLNGEIGLLINPDDKAAIRNAIRQTLNSGNKEDLRRSKQNKCLNHFSFNIYRDRVEQILYPAS